MELHEVLTMIDDVASEHILLRKYADACKIVHLLRAAGSSIEPELFDNYDSVLNASLTRCLGEDLDALALAQARLEVDQGGLEIRHARDIALPAFVVSRIECRWLIAFPRKCFLRLRSRRICCSQSISR